MTGLRQSVSTHQRSGRFARLRRQQALNYEDPPGGLSGSWLQLLERRCTWRRVSESPGGVAERVSLQTGLNGTQLNSLLKSRERSHLEI